MKISPSFQTIFLLLVLSPFHLFSQIKSDVVWKEQNGVSIPVPPKVHPRLYLRSEQVAELPTRMKNPVLKNVWDDLQKLAEERKPSEFPAVKESKYYSDPKGLLTRVELKALNYLVSKDKKLAREAISMIIDTLERAAYPEDISDISRGTGRLMVSGAIVYDWCYDQLKPAEKTRFVNAFIRQAKTLECHYPPVTDDAVAGHPNEFMVMRDLLSVGIAIYDEFPEMYNLTSELFFGKMLPARNWFYQGHAHHQGMSYLNIRFTCDLFPLWIFDRMGAGNVYNPAQQFVLYDMIYKRRPDGQMLPGGDISYHHQRMSTYGWPALLAGSYYKDEYLNQEFLYDGKVENQAKLFEFLWRDTNLGAKKPDDLPLTCYSGTPFGTMIARTGWGAESVIAEMKINEYNFVNHAHNDAGAFQIYYKGPLAIDAGIYQGSSGGNQGYNSPHNKNFFKRTIAHNSLLIYDPNEKFASSNYGGAFKSKFVVNDGGQRLPGVEWHQASDLNDMLTGNFKTGKVLANGFGPNVQMPDYSYLKGDITEAYSAKVKEVKRSFVFLNFKDAKIPAALIVFDKVVASNPDFKKFWLLHSIEQPEISGNKIRIRRTKNGESGQLENTLLLPDLTNADIVPVGGPGKEFWVFGTNYENEPRPGDDDANNRGAWRVEITPKKAAAEDYYLNVMQVADNSVVNLHGVNRIDGDKIVGVQLADRITTFSKNFTIVDRPFDLSVKGSGTFKFVLTDLLPGTWQIIKNGKVFQPAIVVRSDDGVLCFEGGAGEYRFLR